MSREAKRPGMVLYHDKYRALSVLDDHDFRLVLDALMRYSETGEQTALDGYLGAIYQLLAAKLDEDIERYERTIEARREAGRKGGVKSGKTRNSMAKGEANEANAYYASQNEANEANAYFASQNEANEANQNQSPISNQSQKGNQSRKSLSLPPQGQGDGETGEKIPEIFEVMEYAKSAGCERCDEALARRFIASQSASNWRDSNGAPIRNWRTWFDGWYARNVSVTARPAPTSMQYEQRTYTPEALDRLTTAWLEDDEGSDSA